jgi:DNA-binding MarR family transcriptional regulator
MKLANGAQAGNAAAIICIMHVSTGGGRNSRRTANLVGALAVAVVDRLATESDVVALITLLERGPLTIETLRQILGRTHSASVRLVDRLVDRGWLERGAGPDGRSVSVALTRAGRRQASGLRAQRSNALSTALEGLDEREQVVFATLAEKILGSLTDSRWTARHVCRICDHGACAGESAGCPVDKAASAIGE